MKGRSALLVLGVFLALVLGWGPPVLAQVTTGNVFGTVKDTQGGVLPGATVVLTSETRGTKIAPVVTNETGDFVVPNVTADTYTVEVSMQGFKTLLRKGVAVSGGDRVQLGSLVLEVGTLTETVQVTGETPLVQASSGERSFVSQPRPRLRTCRSRAAISRRWRRSLLECSGTSPARRGRQHELS